MRGHAVLTLVRDVPVEPDGETARRLLQDELAEAVYHQRPSLLELAYSWLRDQFGRLLDAAGGVDAGTAALVVVTALVVVAAVSLLVAGPVLRDRAALRSSAQVFGDDTRSAAELLASAESHAAAGDWAAAVLDRFRALLRGLEDRAVLDPRLGRTADEGAREAGTRLPACAVELVGAARLFDDVCYGDVTPGAAEDSWLRDVASRVAATRPVSAAAAPDLDRRVSA